MNETIPAPRLRTAGMLLALAVWTGLLAGVAELGVIAARGAVGARVTSDLLRLNRHSSWMLPASNLAIFAAIGGVLAAIAIAFPQLARRVAGPVLGMLAFAAVFQRVPSLHEGAKWALACGLGLQASRLVRGHAAGFARLVRWTLPAMLVGAAVAGPILHRRVVDSEARALANLPAPATNTPNVLLLVLDTVRADHLSMYGYERETSPNLASIAAMGVRFDQARSAAPWTLPSHASLLTGRWPFELSADEDHAMNRVHPTMAETLAARGYATAGLVANTYYCNAAYGLDRGFARFEDCYENSQVNLGEFVRGSALGRLLYRGAAVMELCPPIEANEGKNAERLNRDLLSWIDARKGQPFFAFVNYLDAHDPYLLPEGDHRRFGLKPETPEDFATLRGWHDSNKQNVTDRQVNLVRDAYDDCIAYLDGQIGALMKELEGRKLLDDTIVIITSDHGEQLGEHRLYGHGRSLYSKELHVPLIVLAPGVPQGAIVAEPASLRDVPATVLGLLGLAAQSPFPGGSLADAWTGRAARPVLSEVAHRPKTTSRNPNRPPAWRGPMASIVAENKVYIRNADGREELYDLTADPDETNDLAKSSAAEPLLNPFRATLERIKTGQADVPRVAGKSAFPIRR